MRAWPRLYGARCACTLLASALAAVLFLMGSSAAAQPAQIASGPAAGPTGQSLAREVPASAFPEAAGGEPRGGEATGASGAPSEDPGSPVTAPAASFAPDRVLVRFRSGASAAAEKQARSSAGATLVRSYRLVPGLELLKVAPVHAAPSALAAIARDPEVLYATRDVAYHVQSIPDDPLFEDQWGMESIGAPEAWEHSTGSSSVTVAVLDTGITLNHPDLEANIWTNPDPGRYGYADDLHGWNFVANDNDPSDDYGHGTHVAGIIGAVGNNGIGVAGVNWSVSVMPLKICNGEGICYLSDEIAALEYAVEHGAKVANASFGGDYGGEKAEEEAIAAAGKAGLLYVAAAGNDASNDDSEPFYPASYPLENIVSVAATTRSGGLASFSDYGPKSVDLGAPGQEILSTLPTSGPLSSSTGYGYLSGTSMATPQVTGAAALLWSEHPSWTMQQVRARLLSTARPLQSLSGKASSCGELDVGLAANPAVPEEASLCVLRSGTGTGSVSSSVGGIECGSSCSAKFAPGTPVTLTATPQAGSTFAGWSGACSGTGPCTVTSTITALVTAVFNAATGADGWEDEPLAAPSARKPFEPGTSPEYTFYNVSLSADGKTRAKTIYNNGSSCTYASDEPGGVYLEEKTESGWMSDGSIGPPSLGSDLGARWPTCADFGTLTQLSADGTTLLVSAEQDSTINPELGPRYRCAAFVYHHGAGGWEPAGTLFPPGVNAQGSTESTACKFFGIGGAMSADGTRAAVLGNQRVDMFADKGTGWSLEQNIVLPEGPECGETIGPKQIAMSGDGAMLLVGSPDCEVDARSAVGRVYVYTRSGSSWSLTQTIESPEAVKFNEFGRTIAISGDDSTAAIDGYGEAAGLPAGAGASWVLQREAGVWHFAGRLTAPTPQPEVYFSCPTIVENGSRIICRAGETVGSNSRQGVIYIFDRPAGGWTASSTPTRLFALEGAAGDHLSLSGHLKWPAFATTADGTEIDTTIIPSNLANGTYPNDRIGYEFAPTGTFIARPEAVSEAPSSITENSATLNAAVNPKRGTVTECEFEYGTSESYGSGAACSPSPGSGSSPVAVSAAIAGLNVDTTYHFRIVATNTKGTDYGADEKFTTKALPPTITGISPTSGAIGSALTITGTNLQSTNAVIFSGSGQVGAGFSVESNTSVRAYVPRGAASGPISVTTAGGTVMSSEEFTVVPVLPEFGRCEKTAKGSGAFSSAKCTAPKSGGSFAWLPGTSAGAFTTQSTGSATLETVSKTTVTCSGESGTGEYTGARAIGGVLLRFTGCEGLSQKCSSLGAAAGEIVSMPLAGAVGVEQLGYTPATNKIALDLEPVGGTGQVMEFTCGASDVSVEGSVIAAVKADKMLSSQTLTFSASKGRQKPESFVGLPADVLAASFGGGAYEQAGLTAKLTETSEEPVEINSAY